VQQAICLRRPSGTLPQPLHNTGGQHSFIGRLSFFRQASFPANRSVLLCFFTKVFVPFYRDFCTVYPTSFRRCLTGQKTIGIGLLPRLFMGTPCAGKQATQSYMPTKPRVKLKKIKKFRPNHLRYVILP
jgi:hypothetical protein